MRQHLKRTTRSTRLAVKKETVRALDRRELDAQDLAQVNGNGLCYPRQTTMCSRID